MANEVRFNIHLKVDGKEHVVQLGGDVQKLVQELKSAGGASSDVRDALHKMGEAMGVASSEAERLNTELLNMNQVKEAFGSLVQVIGEVQGALQGLGAAYAVQERAEVQLQTVMKQRMGATDAEVEGIKRLASAQQALGVIGDEVQLMGAQQMATFLGERESIETLLPAMNDLLAQQKGLNATSEDAVSVGNLLGKAMQGQTSVLTRVGITFTEAEEQVMKFGTESQRAAMLAQVITNNVGHMNAELAKTDIGKQQQLENKLGDIKEQLGQLVQPAQRAIMMVGRFGTAVDGIMRLSTSLTGLRASMNAATASSAALKWSIRGLEIATGIGALIAGLSIAVELFGRKADKSADGADELTDALRREESQVNATRAALEMNIAQLRDFKGSKEDEKKVVEEMNNTYGETMGYFSSVKEWYEALTANSKAYCEQLVIEARMRSLANQVAEKENELDAKRQERRDKVGSGELSTKRPRVAVMGVDAFGNQVVTGWKEGASEAEQYISKIDEELVDGALQINRMKNEMRDLASEAQKVSMPLMGGSIRPGGGGGGSGATAGNVTGGLAGLRQMAGVGSGFTIDVKSVGFDGVAAQVGALGDSLQNPIASLQRLQELLSQVVAEGGLTGETFSELQGIMSGMSSSDAAAAIEAIAAAQSKAAEASAGHAKKVAAAKESIAQFGGALAGLGDALELPALNIAGTIAQAIANIALSYSSATAQAATMGPWAWLAFAATGLAEMTAVIASIKNATAFANGGVVSGPTYALIGEYAGASNNPEVVAPLDKLRGMLELTGGALPETIELVADGRALRAVMRRVGRTYERS